MQVVLSRREIKNPFMEAISSKSYVHRALIGAALSHQKTQVDVNVLSDDMTATMRCLEALGAVCTKTKTGIIVEPIAEHKTNVALDCGESGSTARFLLPVAAQICEKFTMTGKGKLPQRPFFPVCDALRKAGCSVTADYLPITVEGKIEAGTFLLPGDVSSQFISGFLFALPLLDKESNIMLTSELQSKPYVDMTIEVLRQFGIVIEETQNGYLVPGKQSYVSPSKIEIQKDWSNAAFFLSLGALDKKMTVSGLKMNSKQGDRKIIELLEQFGANILVQTDSGKEERITVNRNVLNGIETDVSQIPDLVPILCVVASAANGTSIFHHAQRLRLKESDRLVTTQQMINNLGGHMEIKDEKEDTCIIIEGTNSSFKGGFVNGFNDHRIVMAATCASVICTGNVIIDKAEAVNKSYPGFFDDFETLFCNMKE